MNCSIFKILLTDQSVLLGVQFLDRYIFQKVEVQKLLIKSEIQRLAQQFLVLTSPILKLFLGPFITVSLNIPTKLLLI